MVLTVCLLFKAFGIEAVGFAKLYLPRVIVRGVSLFSYCLLLTVRTVSHIPHINPTRCVVISNICT